MTVPPDTKKRVYDDFDDDTDASLPTPPDGGWGWVIVLSSFFIHIIADGVAYSFGIFLLAFLDYFGGGRGELGWIGSLMVGVTLATGPIASALTNKYGCRIVTMAGSLVAATGFIISVWAPNLYYLYFSYGIVSGFGLGLIYLPAIVSVTYYFEQKRAFATGLAVCGSGIGTFIFAPLSKYLLDEYGWKGATLIEAGFLLNCCVFGALLRPLEPKRSRRRQADVLQQEEKYMLTNGTVPNGAVKEVVANGNVLNKEVVKDEVANVKGELHNVAALPTRTRSMRGLETVKWTEHSLTMHASCHSLPYTAVDAMRDSHGIRRHASEIMLSHRAGDKRVRKAVTAGPLQRKDIFYSGSVCNLDIYRSNPDMYTRSVTSVRETGEMCVCSFGDTLRGMMDLSLLHHPLFLLFAISNLFTSIGFNVPYIYLPDRAIIRGISEGQAAFLISVIGISNTVGRIVFGWLADKKFVDRKLLYNISLMTCGIATIASAICINYELFVFYAAIFGLFIGVYVSLTSIMLVDLLGLDRLTNSFGLLLLFQGVATVIGPPIAGWVFDSTNSYNIAFYITGTMITLSGAMLFTIPCVRHTMRSRYDSECVVEERYSPEGKDPVVSLHTWLAQNNLAQHRVAFETAGLRSVNDVLSMDGKAAIQEKLHITEPHLVRCIQMAIWKSDSLGGDALLDVVDIVPHQR